MAPLTLSARHVFPPPRVAAAWTQYSALSTLSKRVTVCAAADGLLCSNLVPLWGTPLLHTRQSRRTIRTGILIGRPAAQAHAKRDSACSSCPMPPEAPTTALRSPPASARSAADAPLDADCRHLTLLGVLQHLARSNHATSACCGSMPSSSCTACADCMPTDHSACMHRSRAAAQPQSIRAQQNAARWHASPRFAGSVPLN